MVALQEHLDKIEDHGAALLGISADSSFVQEAFTEYTASRE
ncbi:hypothetical protein [Halovenus halobia]